LLMKVLHLPVNIASQISSTVRALQNAGVEARGLARNFSSIQSHDCIDVIDWSGALNPAARLLRGIRWRSKLVRAVAWADVVHWHWGDTTWKQIDLSIVERLGKARLVEFWGDDLREPVLASRDNPVLAEMYRRYPELANQRSKAAQQMFARRGFACLIPGYELADYLYPAIFSGYYQTRPRLLLQDYSARFPDSEQKMPLLVHAPSDKARKGTEAVLAAIEDLRKDYSFEFKLIHQMPRDRALATVSAADVFLDQFTVGAEGLAALEAMALGKPVVCFIKESLRGRYPAACPIVTADQGSLRNVIASLLENGAKRKELGVQGRQYVEAYHDARILAGELLEIYRELLEATRQAGNRSRLGHCRFWCPLNTEPRRAEACVP
jgi:glycosyltransferase involved in cell wall biosynthesis